MNAVHNWSVYYDTFTVHRAKNNYNLLSNNGKRTGKVNRVKY